MKESTKIITDLLDINNHSTLYNDYTLKNALLHKLEYDENHNIREIISFDKDEKILGEEVFSYNEKRERITCKTYDNNDLIHVYEEFDKSRKTIYFYNDTHQLKAKKLIIYQGDLIIETIKLDENDRIEYSIKYNYDEQLNLIEEIIHDRIDNIKYKLIRSYDDNGLLKDCNKFAPNDTLIYHLIYDTNQRIKTLYKYDKDNLLCQKYVYEYYEKGMIKEEKIYSMKGFISHWKTYDIQGILIRHLHYDENGILNTKVIAKGADFDYHNKILMQRIPKDAKNYYVYDSNDNLICINRYSSQVDL